MNITPERALELAGKAECGALNSDPYGRDDFDEIADFLRHYAEIAPKWQAVLDAEVVATAYRYVGRAYTGNWTVFYRKIDKVEPMYEYQHLIIKPSP